MKHEIGKYIVSMAQEFDKLQKDTESEKKNRRIWKLARKFKK